MLSTYYNRLNFAEVEDLPDLYHSGLPESQNVKSVIENCKSLFKLPADRVVLQVSEGDRVYKILLLSPDVNKFIFGWIIMVPLQKQLDLYSGDNPSYPIAQWKNKKIAYKGYSMLFDRAGIEKTFDRIVNASS